MVAKKIVKKLIWLFHQSLFVLDRPLLRKDVHLKWPPVFILGTPRSGTTLLYQLLIQSFNFAYFSNMANSFYMCPLTATKIGLKLCHPYRTNFSSVHGFEKGCLSPSEAGNIWNRWFPHEKKEGFNYTPENYLSEKSKEEILKIIAHEEEFYFAPFLTKNVKNNVRIQAIREIFPAAIFINIRRNPIDSALSILRIRRKKKLEWWSVMPKEIDRLRNLSDWEQVCYQVFYTEMNASEDLKTVHTNQLFEISYKELCKNPGNELKRIQEFLLQYHQIEIKNKNVILPEEFEMSSPKTDGWIEKDEVNHIKNLLNQLYQNSSLNKLI